MSTQKETNNDLTDSQANGDVFKTKKKPKAIRVLTVMAYVLSVSMAAILLSIYYIFMWEGTPHIGAISDDRPEILTQNQTHSQSFGLVNNNSEVPGERPSADVKEVPILKFENITSSYYVYETDVAIGTSNATGNATANQINGESTVSPDDDDDVSDYNTTAPHVHDHGERHLV